MVLLILALAAFAFWHLSTAGSDYRKLTTSDSGFFFGIARQMNESDSIVEKYELAYPPEGQSISRDIQLHPLMLTMTYRGMNQIDSNITLLDIAMYYSPIIFILSMIGVFLTAREFAGDLAGYVAAILLIVNVQLIYWVKSGALDNEITHLFFISWSIFMFTKLFKTRERNNLFKYGVLSGLVYGLFLISWTGAMFIGPVLVLTIILLLLFRLPSHFTSLDELEKAFHGVIKESKNLLIGVALVFLISTTVAVVFGGKRPDFWVDMFGRVFGYLGIGGGSGGLSSPMVASEQQAPSNFIGALRRNLYADRLLFAGTFTLAVGGVLKTIWKRKPRYLFILAMFITISAMSMDQSRFFRQMWPVWPVLCAVGLSFFVEVGGRVFNSRHVLISDWNSKLRKPVVIALVGVILVVPFFYNAREDVSADVISQTYRYSHGSSLSGNEYHDLVDSFDWLRENSPEDCIAAIEWSYGHFLTGYANRRSVTDGAQVTDVWNDKTTPPPDIVQQDVDNDGVPDDTTGDGRWERTDEGRRTQIQDLQMAAENEFRSIVTGLADSNLKIDYIVFDFRNEDSILYQNMDDVNSSPDNYSTSENGIEYEFDNLTVFYDGQSARLVSDGENQPVNLYVLYLERSGGQDQVVDIRNVGGYNPSEDAPYNFFLLFKYRGYEQQGLRMLDDDIPQAGFGRFETPVMSKVLNEYEVPSFLDVEHLSPNGNFGVARIDWENLS